MGRFICIVYSRFAVLSGRSGNDTPDASRVGLYKKKKNELRILLHRQKRLILQIKLREEDWKIYPYITHYYCVSISNGNQTCL